MLQDDDARLQVFVILKNDSYRERPMRAQVRLGCCGPAPTRPPACVLAYATPACVPAIRRVTPDAGRAVSPTTPLPTCSAEAATRH